MIIKSGDDRRSVRMILWAGKANGMDTIGVLYGFGNREELEEAGADIIAGDTRRNIEILRYVRRALHEGH